MVTVQLVPESAPITPLSVRSHRFQRPAKVLDGEPFSSSSFVSRSSACRTVARHAGQVLSGIGFTTEHAFHHYMKRTMALEGLFGSADAIVLDVGRRLLAERQVPTLIEL